MSVISNRNEIFKENNSIICTELGYLNDNETDLFWFMPKSASQAIKKMLK